ncbi:MAG: hypothetical protein RLY78_4268, partial [Pseudomonadota bacterium]
ADRIDAILPSNGVYPQLALRPPPAARERLFYSRVAIGVKASRARELGWDRQAPDWAAVARAARDGRLRYAMSNPTRSNTGMSVLFALASSAAGRTEGLTLEDTRQSAVASRLKDFLSGQALTAGSSGWLVDAYVRDQATLDALVNYEAVLTRLNQDGRLKEPLVLVFPREGIVSADYPLMLLAPASDGQRARHERLVQAWRTPAFQRDVVAAAGLRPSIAEVAAPASLPSGAVSEIGLPARAEVIEAVLAATLGEWRRPASAIFVLDTSNSMQGERMLQVKQSFKVLAGLQDERLAARLSRFQQRERVILLPFSSQPAEAVRFTLDAAGSATRAQLVAATEALQPHGGTAIYSALINALRLARQELHDDPQRLPTIVLLTDGANTAGEPPAAFDAAFAEGPPVRVFTILFGEGEAAALQHIAELSGGQLFDAKRANLTEVFKDIRGYQ